MDDNNFYIKWMTIIFMSDFFPVLNYIDHMKSH